MSKDNREELKPCPFCGGDANIYTDPSIFKGQDYGDRYPKKVSVQNHGYQVRCECCNSKGCYWHYEEEAIKAWNTREVTTDSGADVCEWEDCFIRYTTSCDAITSIDLEEVNDSSDTPIKYCPYCGKPITIKGE